MLIYLHFIGFSAQIRVMLRNEEHDMLMLLSTYVFIYIYIRMFENNECVNIVNAGMVRLYRKCPG